MTRKFTNLLLVLVALVAMSSDAHAQGGNANPGIIPPDAEYRGFSYDELSALWWIGVFDIPADADHPFASGQPFQGPRGIAFLVGAFADPDEPVVFEITIPERTPLFFPVVNTSCSVFEGDPFHGDNEEELRECANGHVDGTSDRFAFIDGRPVRNLDAYRTESPLFIWGPLPEENLFGDPDLEGVISPAVDAGFYLLLAPLSKGEHIIHFGGTSASGGVINTVYLITVVPDEP